VTELTAAAMHGASHQAPQVFQVMVDRHVPNRDIGRVRLRFYVNEHLGHITVEERQVDTGRLRLATLETTLVDLIAHPDEAGGLNNLATVIVAIGYIDVVELARLAMMRSRSVVRRLRWLLDQFRDDLDLQPLRETTLAPDTHPTRLVRALPARGPLDQSWNLQVNTSVEPDL
jgi:predicted transcriptional regulator of viral defense system